jgi:hypothetical protein
MLALDLSTLERAPVTSETAFPLTHLVYSSSSSLSSSLYGLFGSLLAGGVAGILFTRSLEALVNPGLKSSSAVREVVSGGTIGADDGEVESKSTRFFGRMPSLAEFISPVET